MIVDAYFPFADRVEDEIDEIQDNVMGRADRATLARVFDAQARADRPCAGPSRPCGRS